MLYRINFLIINLLFMCVPFQAMRRDMQLTPNWDYKERESSCLNSFFPKSTVSKYPYFSSEKDGYCAKRSLLDELLFAERVLKPELLKDTIGIILRYSYLIEEHSNQALIKRYTKVFYRESSDLLYLNQLDKQTLLYVLYDGLKDNEIRIEGRDKDFAKKMFKNILRLPLPIREKIIDNFGPEIMCNTNYKPLWRNIVLDDEINKECCACAVTTVSTGCCYCGTHCALKELVKWPIPKWSIAFTAIVLSSWTGRSDLLIREDCIDGINYCLLTASLYCCFTNLPEIVHKYLSKETQEERDKRLGFETVSLLEMECEIVDAH